MEFSLYHLFLYLHIIAGHIALVTGIITFIRKKGDSKHRLIGKVYFWSMFTIAVSAFYLSIVKDNTFLFLMNVFVVYQLMAGMLAVKKKMKPINIVEGILLLAFLANAVFMIRSSNIVLMGFGALSILLGVNDIKFFYRIHKNKIVPKAWLARHIGLMMGSFIGAVTAFLVVNIRFQPAWLIWFAPTIILVPIMVIWTRKYTSTKQRV